MHFLLVFLALIFFKYIYFFNFWDYTIIPFSFSFSALQTLPYTATKPASPPTGWLWQTCSASIQEEWDQTQSGEGQNHQEWWRGKVQGPGRTDQVSGAKALPFTCWDPSKPLQCGWTTCSSQREGRSGLVDVSGRGLEIDHKGLHSREIAGAWALNSSLACL